MDDRDLAHMLLQDHFTASAALVALMLKNLPAEVRTRVMDTVRDGTGKVELRTRVESNETELVPCRRMGRRRYGSLIRRHVSSRTRAAAAFNPRATRSAVYESITKDRERPRRTIAVRASQFEDFVDRYVK